MNRSIQPPQNFPKAQDSSGTLPIPLPIFRFPASWGGPGLSITLWQIQMGDRLLRDGYQVTDSCFWAIVLIVVRRSHHMPLLEIPPMVSGNQMFSAMERTWVSLSMHNTRATWNLLVSAALSVLYRHQQAQKLPHPDYIRAKHRGSYPAPAMTVWPCMAIRWKRKVY